MRSADVLAPVWLVAALVLIAGTRLPSDPGVTALLAVVCVTMAGAVLIRFRAKSASWPGAVAGVAGFTALVVPTSENATLGTAAGSALVGAILLFVHAMTQSGQAPSPCLVGKHGQVPAALRRALRLIPVAGFVAAVVGAAALAGTLLPSRIVDAYELRRVAGPLVVAAAALYVASVLALARLTVGLSRRVVPSRDAETVPSAEVAA